MSGCGTYTVFMNTSYGLSSSHSRMRHHKGKKIQEKIKRGNNCACFMKNRSEVIHYCGRGTRNAKKRYFVSSKIHKVVSSL